MSLPQEIHLGDFGTIFQVTIYDGDSVVNLSGASSVSIILKKPNKQTVTKIATVSGDGTAGVVACTISSGDLDTIGTWRMQAEVVFPSGLWRSNVTEFEVYANLAS